MERLPTVMEAVPMERWVYNKRALREFSVEEINNIMYGTIHWWWAKNRPVTLEDLVE